MLYSWIHHLEDLWADSFADKRNKAADSDPLSRGILKVESIYVWSVKVKIAAALN